MSLGSTGTGGVQSSAAVTPVERPETAAIDPSEISFAGVLAQLFQSAPPTGAQADFNSVAPPAQGPEKAPAREPEPPSRPTPNEPREVDSRPADAPVERADRSDPPEDSADDEQTLPPARPEPESRPEQSAARTDAVSTPVAATVVAPVVVEAAPIEAVGAPPTPPPTTPPPVEPPSVPVLSRDDVPVAPPQAPAGPASPAPTDPQDPSDAGEVRSRPEAPSSPPPSPAPTDVPLPPIVRSAEGVLEAQALGAAPAQPPVDAASSPTFDPASSADPAAPRLDVLSASSQVTAAGVAPAGQGAQTGLDARTGQQGTNPAPAVAAAGGASQGTPAADMGQAPSPRPVHPGPMIDRVVRGMRLSMKSGQSRMRFLLTPPSLGSVTVDLEVKHGVLSAHIAADSAEARDLLTRNIAALSDSLKDQGIRVGELLVSARQDGERGNASYGQQGGGLPAPSGGEVAVEDSRAYADERRRLLAQNQIVDLMA